VPAQSLPCSLGEYQVPLHYLMSKTVAVGSPLAYRTAVHLLHPKGRRLCKLLTPVFANSTSIELRCRDVVCQPSYGIESRCTSATLSFVFAIAACYTHKVSPAAYDSTMTLSDLFIQTVSASRPSNRFGSPPSLCSITPVIVVRGPSRASESSPDDPSKTPERT
jgi:hypothetical protein